MLDGVKIMLKNWLGISEKHNDTTMYGDICLLETDKRFKDLENLAWYSGDRDLLRSVYLSNKYEYERFWSMASLDRAEVVHSPIATAIIDTLAALTIYDVTRVETKYEKNLNIDPIQTMLLGMLIFGSAAIYATREENTEEVKYKLFLGSNAQYDGSKYILKEQIMLEDTPMELIRYVEKESVSYELVDLTAKDNRFRLRNPESFGYYGFTIDEKTPVIFATTDKDFLLNASHGILSQRAAIFDALDETLTQLRDAIRITRPSKYIPETMIQIDLETGRPMRVKALENTFMVTKGEITEGEFQKIQTETPYIMVENYRATQEILLEQVLFGLLSPATLGLGISSRASGTSIREREKQSALTRKKIVSEIVEPCIRNFIIMDAWYKDGVIIESNEITLEFGEYSAQDFETVLKTNIEGYKNNLISLETVIENLYGSSWTEEQKREEIRRLKEQKTMSNPIKKENVIEEVNLNEDEDNLQFKNTQKVE